MTDQNTSVHSASGDEDQRKLNIDEDVAEAKRPQSSEGGWIGFIALRDSLGEMPGDFLADRGQRNEGRDPFADEPE